jgi:hypothetical protein
MSSVLSSGLNAGLDFTSPLLSMGRRLPTMAPFFPAARSSLDRLDDHVGVAVLAGAITVRPEDEVKELALVQGSLVDLVTSIFAV